MNVVCCGYKSQVNLCIILHQNLKNVSVSPWKAHPSQLPPNTFRGKRRMMAKDRGGVGWGYRSELFKTKHKMDLVYSSCYLQSKEV